VIYLNKKHRKYVNGGSLEFLCLKREEKGHDS
jgi:hypothetical protein